jgi:BirA family transcriptional regulator, biotin operon repressor / biotin---[acetyl-CoA-carboxylase] ligase
LPGFFDRDGRVIFTRTLEIDNPFQGAPVYFLEETTSTMENARDLADRGAADGTVIVAGFQTAGRGRFPARAWTAAPGDSLLCTLIFRTRNLKLPAGALPLVLGLAVSLVLERDYCLVPSIKWPNDVLIEGRKLCGILCRLHGETVLAGIGMNCRQADFPGELNETAVSLRQVLNHPVEPLEVLVGFLREVFNLVRRPAEWRNLITTRMFGRGERVIFLAGIPPHEDRVEGWLVGIDADGQLLIREDNGRGIRAFPAGELKF